MQEIKDEDRIIGKICRGELSIVDRDIKNLANANLTEAEEENFRKLAQEINETIDRNQALRQEMKEQLEVVENNDFFVRKTLSKIDNQINDLRYQYNKKKFTPAWKLVLGTLLTIFLGFVPPFIVSIFTASIWALGIATFVGFFTGVGIDIGLAVKSVDKCEAIQKQIKELEKARLEIISDGVDDTKTQENETKMNIVKNIYKTREQEKQHVDILDL